MVKVRFVSFLFLGIVAAGANFHTLASQEMAETFAQEMLTQLQAQISVCPESMPDPGPYRVVACARLKLKDKEFKRTWDRLAWQRRKKPCFVLEVKDWTKNEQGCEKIYEVDGTPFKVFWNAQSGYVILSYIKDVELCTDSHIPPEPLPFNYDTSESRRIPPKLISNTRIDPFYPLKAKKARQSGSVVLQAIIKVDGTVGDICVLEVTSPGYGFEQAALNAVRKWRYSPAFRDGKVTQVYFTVTVRFSIP